MYFIVVNPYNTNAINTVMLQYNVSFYSIYPLQQLNMHTTMFVPNPVHLYNTIQYNSNAMQCNAMQCNAIQCNAMQCNAMQYNNNTNKCTLQCLPPLYQPLLTIRIRINYITYPTLLTLKLKDCKTTKK